MRVRYAVPVLILALTAFVAGQTQSPYTHPGKVLIRSNATDALTVNGGIVASQLQAATVTATTQLSVTNNDPIVFMTEPDAPTDAKRWRWISSAGNLLLQAQNDAGSVNNNAWQFIQSAGTPTQVRSGADGTASVPAYSFVSDPDTGFYRYSADSIGIAAGGSLWGRFKRIGTESSFEIADAPNGAGAFAGQSVYIGANNSGLGAPGTLRITTKSASIQVIFPDSSGNLRIATSVPTESGGDTIGTVVGTQTSQRSTKNILGRVTDTATAAALIRHTPVYRFTYKSGAYNGETFTGIVTDDSPQFGMDRGKSFNPVSAFGTTVLALQDADRRIAALEAQLRGALKRIDELQTARKGRQ